MGLVPWGVVGKCESYICLLYRFIIEICLRLLQPVLDASVPEHCRRQAQNLVVKTKNPGKGVIVIDLFLMNAVESFLVRQGLFCTASKYHSVGQLMKTVVISVDALALCAFFQ